MIVLDEPDNPTLGQYLTFLRERESQQRHRAGVLPSSRKLSRERAARESHITASYLTKVERDEVGQVDIGILRLLTNTYHASDAEWCYVCDLGGYASPYPTLAGLDLSQGIPPLKVFQNALTPMMRTEMEESDTDLVSFFAPQRRLIAANRAYYETYPNHQPGMYMLEWSFTPDAHEVLINWKEQVEVGVARHRGIMGRYGRSEWAQQAHRRLWQFPEFRRMWETGDVAYSVPLDLQAHLRVRGCHYTLLMESWQLEHDLPILRTRGRLRPLS
ncbi:helix-turn-helix transcriptional regulator [Nocardia sp. NEAU-G5]|uniref:Helix-turn-helix transcriptional regulator n=1 Tax=Nocardia albiluteola TaxID=2842303 RepID=A0ABS6BD53_9NOCA|nr:helix-turn-helix domain-containing protein [Nocardia albiluteola]MBU3067406.1 helix-turn-helix transcriptional regulator [Nocardia albiluteola]